MTGVTAPRIADPAVKVWRELAIGAAVAAAVAATFALAPISHASGEAAALESAGRLSVIAIPVAVGLYAWRRVPFARFGALLIASGLVWLAATFSLANGSVAYSITVDNNATTIPDTTSDQTTTSYTTTKTDGTLYLHVRAQSSLGNWG